MTRIATMATTTLADAKSRLSHYVQCAQDFHERTIITKNGRPVAAIISVDDLESMEETLAVLSDPELMAGIRVAEAEVARGELASESEVRADLAARRARR